VDIVGYFTSGTPAPGGFTGISPDRALDTGNGSNVLCAGAPRKVNVLGRGQVPASGVDSVAVNLTVDRPTQGGYLTLWPGGPQPATSAVNFTANQSDGTITIANYAGCARVIVDIVGYFTSG
jgi:hypothetical protein